METWMKIASAIALGLMLVFLLPRAKQMIAGSPAAQKGDWNAALLPIAAVVIFVIVLMRVWFSPGRSWSRPRRTAAALPECRWNRQPPGNSP